MRHFPFVPDFAKMLAMKISAVIIAGNEEKKIATAVRSVAWADEIIVVDSESTDWTREIAESEGARVIVQKWNGFSAQKQFAVDAAAHDWIFSLDADEEVSSELTASIQDLRLSGSANIGGYRIARRSVYMGRPIAHSGWYPDWQLRLFDRRKGRWSGSIIHESFKVNDGVSTGRLKGDMIHRSVDSALEHHQMIGSRYAPLAARQMLDNGRTTSIPRILTAGLTAFISSYFLKLGILDGLPGFCIASFAAHHAFLKHVCLWELQNSDAKT
jgi:glycosyltransferase involved in cell wall biosynthesis